MSEQNDNPDTVRLRDGRVDAMKYGFDPGLDDACQKLIDKMHTPEIVEAVDTMFPAIVAVYQHGYDAGAADSLAVSQPIKARLGELLRRVTVTLAAGKMNPELCWQATECLKQYGFDQSPVDVGADDEGD